MDPGKEDKKEITELEKIDILRQRMGVGYREAKSTLDLAGGDLVKALVDLEEVKFAAVEKPIYDKGQEMVNQVRGLFYRGNTTKVRLKRGKDTIFEIPATAAALGVVGAMTNVRFALLGAVGTLAALASRCRLEVDRVEIKGDHDKERGHDHEYDHDHKVVPHEDYHPDHQQQERRAHRPGEGLERAKEHHKDVKREERQEDREGEKDWHKGEHKTEEDL